MIDETLTIILKDTFSQAQFKTRVRLLKSNLLKAIFGGETFTSEESKLAPSEVAPSEDLNWLKSLPPSFYQKFNKDNVYDIFSELEQAIIKFPTLTIYLAFEPDEITLYNLGTFIRKDFGPSFMLDIKIDPSLIAGCALVWKGIYKDYSLRAKIEQGKTEIAEGFRKFLR